MAFVRAMSAPDAMTIGVNGSSVYTEHGVRNNLVAFYTKLVRGLSGFEIQETIDNCIREGICSDDMWRLAFQTRNIRGGKGERDLFVHLFRHLFFRFPEEGERLIALIPEFGCWSDLWRIWKSVEATFTYPSVWHGAIKRLRMAIDKTVYKVFYADLNGVDGQRPLSLLGKWLPREGARKYPGLAEHFAEVLYSDIENADDRMRAYRQACSHLNRCLMTTEVKMCEGKWTEIDPSRVPVRCMAKCKKAFFNNIVGIDNKKRYECATRFSRYCMDMMRGRVRMKCANVLVPHEIIGMSFLHSANADELALLQAQWNSIRDNIRASMKDCRTIAMCDFSESMRGVPVRVSAAMGILLSEVAHPAFRDHILTFDSKPRWFSFHSGQSLAEKVRLLFNSDCGQGDSTNFEAACDLILRKLVENRVPPEEIPNDLVVFTDMGWNAVAGASVTRPTEWNTHFLTLQRKFYDHGYKLPRIIIWNLRAEYKEFHATAQEAGVIMISGWSPSAFRILFDGTLDVIQSDGLIRKILDDPMYDSIRNVLVNAA